MAILDLHTLSPHGFFNAARAFRARRALGEANLAYINAVLKRDTFNKHDHRRKAMQSEVTRCRTECLRLENIIEGRS